MNSETRNALIHALCVSIEHSDWMPHPHCLDVSEACRKALALVEKEDD